MTIIELDHPYVGTRFLDYNESLAVEAVWAAQNANPEKYDEMTSALWASLHTYPMTGFTASERYEQNMTWAQKFAKFCKCI